MKKLIKVCGLTIPLLTLICYSCGDRFYDIAPPGDQLTDANFFTSKSDAQAALNGVYDGIQKDAIYRGSALSKIEYFPTGDAVPNAGEPDDFDFYKLEWERNWFRLENVWRALYTMINRANVTIANVEAMDNSLIDAEAKDQIVAQAKYLRAIMYFPLARLFGNIPLVVDPPSLDGVILPEGSPVADVWAQIIQDLQEAAPLLPLSWDDTNTGRATRSAALAMLSKISLYANDYNGAVTYAEQVIALGEDALLPEYRSVFADNNENNAEMIFSTQNRVIPGGGWRDDNEGVIAITQSELPGNIPSEVSTAFGGWGGYSPSMDLINTMETNDQDSIIDERLRGQFLLHNMKHPDLDFVFDTAVHSTNTGVAFTKYWHQPNPAVDPQYSGTDRPIIRYAEVLLDYAEALNEVGRTSDALAALNQVRNRAGLPDFTSASSEEILNQIFRDRRIETYWEHNFFSEINRRGLFLDWVRENRSDIDDLDLNKPFFQQQPIRMPIPITELEVNPNLTQNPGYDF
ncbi:MAG: RagB/SusD family nutrient uptake outer membrane protein [Tunicatimonas sp.]